MMYFLVYDDETHSDYLICLLDSVQQYGPQFQTRVFSKSSIDPEFYSRNRAILDLPRGGGYWLWKPYIINTVLQEMEEGDILFYMDSSYYFMEEFSELYNAHMSSNDILVWANKPGEGTYDLESWCKMDVMLKYGVGSGVKKCWAGAIMLRNTSYTQLCMMEWLDMCCCYEDITDSPSHAPNLGSFCEHRHDQALLSIVLSNYGVDLPYLESRYLLNVRVQS
jgi:hypothetical protein